MIMLSFCTVIFFSIYSNLHFHNVFSQIIYDKDNIPLNNYGDIKGKYIGYQYNAVTVSQRADKFYNDYINDGNESSKKEFLKYVDWIMNNTKNVGNYSFVVYKFPFPVYNLTSPWYSAMAQGEIIPRLLKAYQLTNNIKYLNTANNALNVLFIDIDNFCKCGVTYKTNNSGWWYEEYANGRENGPRVLNGMMFTLLDIYSFYNFTKSMPALFLFNQGLLSLKNELSKYDKNGTYSSYDKYHGFAPPNYHYIHICLLGKLFSITKDNTIGNFYNKWKTTMSSGKTPLNKYTCNLSDFG
jgi:heparosan-N-sulfate-glucuronate 5-epimerase